MPPGRKMPAARRAKQQETAAKILRRSPRRATPDPTAAVTERATPDPTAAATKKATKRPTQQSSPGSQSSSSRTANVQPAEPPTAQPDPPIEAADVSLANQVESTRPVFEVESITNPRMVEIFGEMRPNPFFETLPRPPVQNSHNPSVLHIIDGPRAEREMGESIDRTLAKSKSPDMNATSGKPNRSRLLAGIYDRATKQFAMSKIRVGHSIERPAAWALPHVPVEEIDKLMSIA